MKEIESEANTVAEAVESGLKTLGLRRDQVEVQVLQEASSGFLGFGTKPARVLLREKRWEPDTQRPKSPYADRGRSPRSNRDKPSASGGQRARQPRPERPAERDRQRPPAPKREAEKAGFASSSAMKEGGAEPSQTETNGEPSRTRPEVLTEPPGGGEMTKSILMEILNLGGLSYTSLKAQWDHEQTRIRAEVETPDSQFLVGRDGHNLQALQFLVNLILNRRLKSNVAVQVDVMGYWKSKEEGIRNQVKRAVEEVRRTGRPHRMEPMDPAFRRLVHRSLVNHPDIETASEGEGPYRKVVLKPRKRS